MASYRVFLKPSAARELESLSSRERRRILKIVESLSSNPRPHGIEKLAGRNPYRVRSGNYRVLLEIEDENRTVRVFKIGHRGDVYR